MEINSRLDITEIFCDVDDFYQSERKVWAKTTSAYSN
jgi:hypothetical protein